MEYIILVFLLLWLASCGISSRPQEYRWEEPLPESIAVLEGDNLILTYGYTAPPDVTGKVKVELSHRIPSNKYENVLIVANINQLNQQQEVTHELIPGRVIINASDHKFTFTLSNVKLTEWGRYWTDATFSTGRTLGHWIEVAVYQRPSFKRTPPNDIVSNENDTAIFQWRQTYSDIIPEVETIRIRYRNYTLVHHRKLPNTGQWVITYPDVYGTFENRISYTTSPKFQHISFTLWDLSIEDSGVYTLEIIYRNQMIELENSTTLVVTPGYHWAATPNKTSFLVAQHKNRLDFKVDTKTGNTFSLNYNLYKLGNMLDEILLLHVLVNGGITMHHAASFTRNWEVELNVTSTTLVITITDPTRIDSGSYVLKLTNHAQSVVLMHEFDIVILNEADLTPIIKTSLDSSDNSTVFCFSIDVRNPLPNPDIVVYMGNDTCHINGSLPQNSSYPELANAVYARANDTSRLEICIARSVQCDLVVSIVVIYGNTAAGVRIQSDINVPQAQPGRTRSHSVPGSKDEESPQQQTYKTWFIFATIGVNLLSTAIFFVVRKTLVCSMNGKRQSPDNKYDPERDNNNEAVLLAVPHDLQHEGTV